MNDEFKNDEISDEQDRTTLQKIKEWTQENLRIIISVLVVFLIASSIYSYSKRGEQKTNVASKDNDIEKILGDLSSSEKDKQADITDKSATDTAEKPADSANSAKETSTDNTSEKTASAESENPTPAETEKKAPTEKVAPESPSQETESSFIESASSGDGLTNLARKALSHYLEKNPDSALTPEHKIYIEDYLRKNVDFKGGVHIGTSVEFSKNLIKNAIDASKNLNDAQLKNLHKYAVNVQF